MIYLTMNVTHQRKSYHIIMVDDDEDDIFIMRKELRKAGFGDESFQAVNGGPELLSLLREQDRMIAPETGPDLILLDINMPRMDGFEVLAQLKSDETARNIPVIMFSTSSQSADVKKCFTLGAADYIVKPRELNEFQDTINRIITFLRQRANEDMGQALPRN